MANEEKKDVFRDQDPYDPMRGKRKVVLGEEDFSEAPAPGAAPSKPYAQAAERDEPDQTPGSETEAAGREETAHQAEQKDDAAAEHESGGGFFRKFINREPDGVEPVAGARVNQPPRFDEEKDALLAEESTREAPMRLLGEDDSTETTAARMVREKDYAAMASQEIKEPRTAKPTTDLERRNRRIKNNFIGGLIFAVIALLLYFFAPQLQEMIFKTQDNSLIFSPASGIFGPRAGIVEILLGILGLILVFSTFFTKRKEERLSKQQAQQKPSNPLRTAGLLMLILIPIGFASLFNFTEFRNDDIRFSSLFNQNKAAAYNQVQKQTIYNEGNDIFYQFDMIDAPNTTVKITDHPVESVKLLDLKLPVTRNVSISTEVIDKLVEREIYTRDEALRLFINK